MRKKLQLEVGVMVTELVAKSHAVVPVGRYFSVISCFGLQCTGVVVCHTAYRYKTRYGFLLCKLSILFLRGEHNMSGITSICFFSLLL